MQETLKLPVDRSKDDLHLPVAVETSRQLHFSWLLPNELQTGTNVPRKKATPSCADYSRFRLFWKRVADDKAMSSHYNAEKRVLNAVYKPKKKGRAGVWWNKGSPCGNCVHLNWKNGSFYRWSVSIRLTITDHQILSVRMVFVPLIDANGQTSKIVFQIFRLLGACLLYSNFSQVLSRLKNSNTRTKTLINSVFMD